MQCVSLMMDAEAVTSKIINTYYSDSRALEDCDLVILGIMLLVTYTSCMKKYRMWTCFFLLERQIPTDITFLLPL